MKILLSPLSAFLILTFSASGSVIAAGGPDRRPCQNIGAACRAAGFVKGAAGSNKGLIKDCIKPIMTGQPVSGVTVNPADVQACKVLRAKRKSGS